ncbi:hypothetical protein WBJ53_11665 [Spirosoma sp. SC4-14]|uniref:hypothetical protein n=1 Tax=Spirosoma sp. SC4-14 TaxID=3128900 RepID=UPI0030CC503F
MSRLLHILIGPELFWALLVLASVMLAQANVPPSKSIDGILEDFHLWIALAGLLTFAFWFVPGVERNWLMLRIWIASVIGAHLAMDKALSAYSQQGPGIGTVYIVGMLFLFFVLVLGSIVVKVFYA